MLHGVTNVDVARSRTPCAGYARRVAPILLLQSDGTLIDGTRREIDEPNVTLVRSGRLDRPHQTWGPAGAAMLEALATGWRTSVANGTRVMVRPHHADVLSDIQRCLAFARAERSGLLLAMDPVAILAPSMLDRAEEHLRRSVDATRECPGLGAVVLTNARMDKETHASPIHDGRLSSDVVRQLATGLLEIAAARRVPVICLADRWAEQSGVLASWGLAIG